MSTHPRRRRGLAALAALMLGVVTALFGASPAQAAGYIYHGPGGSYGVYDFSVADDWMHLQSHPQDMTTGNCWDTIFDWYRGPGHYDARLARSCKDWTARNTQRSNESSAINLVNVQRLGVCYGPNQYTNSSSAYCTNRIGTVIGVNVTVGPNNLCTRAWSMTPTGTLQFFGAGIPWECYA